MNPNQPIKIGNHCWICSRCLILKGTALKDNCILGGDSTFTGAPHEENQLLVGVPAKPIKSGVFWQENAPEGIDV